MDYACACVEKSNECYVVYMKENYCKVTWVMWNASLSHCNYMTLHLSM